MLVAGEFTGMSAIFVPDTPLQTSLTTELPVSKIWMSTTEAPSPMALLAVRLTWYSPATLGVPLMRPLVELKFSPGGKPRAVKALAELAPVTVKLKGCPKKPTALSGLVIAVGAAGTVAG